MADAANTDRPTTEILPSDSVLLRRYAAERCEAAFAELVRRHVDGVYSAALRRVGGDAHLAHDVTQQVFIALERKAAALPRDVVLIGWLFTATRNESTNLVRREQRRRAREREAELMQQTHENAGASADWSRLAPVLDTALDELKEADRLAILLRCVEQKAFAEVGRVLRVSEDAARMRVERALEKLRAALERRGFTSTATALGVALGSQAMTVAPAGLAASVVGAAAAGATSATTGFAWLGFMANSNASLLVSITAATVALLAGWNEQQAANQATTDLDARRVELRRVELQVADCKRRVANEAPRPAQPRVGITLRPIVPELVRQSLGDEDPVTAGEAFLAAHPEAQEMLAGVRWATFEQNWGRHLRAFLPAEEWAAIAEEIGDAGEWTFCITERGWSYGLGDGTGEAESVRLAQAQIASALRERLGEARWQELREAVAHADVHDLLRDVAVAVSDSDTPLSATQAVELAAAIARRGKRVAIVNGLIPGAESIAVRNIDWPALQQELTGRLAPAQLAALDHARQRAAARRRELAAQQPFLFKTAARE